MREEREEEDSSRVKTGLTPRLGCTAVAGCACTCERTSYVHADHAYFRGLHSSSMHVAACTHARALAGARKVAVIMIKFSLQLAIHVQLRPRLGIAS